MFKWLLSMGMIPVFRRKTQKRRYTLRLPQIFRSDFESASIFSFKIHLSMNSGAFYMLGTEKCQKREIFYCRVQYRMLHHTLYVGSHEL